MATKGNQEYIPGVGWRFSTAPDVMSAPPSLVTSSLDPRFQVPITQAQTVPAASSQQGQPVVGLPGVVMNPDGSITTSRDTMQSRGDRPELLDADPGGSSGFNLPDVQQFAAGEPNGQLPSWVWLAGAAALLLFLGSR